MTPILIASLLLLSCLAYYVILRHVRGTLTTSYSTHNEKIVSSSSNEEEKDPYTNIQPLPNFDWKSTPPIRNSPLKPKYHLTMALENITLSDILAMDQTYADRMQIRRKIMLEQGEASMMCNPVCHDAVTELYEWIFGVYLPRRFEGMFEKIENLGEGKEKERREEGGKFLHNLISDEFIPLHEPDPLQALRTLGAHVDTDFLLLLPSSSTSSSSVVQQQQHEGREDGGGAQEQPIYYHLQAFICCFPSGFSLQKDKIGRTLAEIHAPVPGYKTKLEKSMDRFFAKLPKGKAVKRSNWAITTDEILFKEGGNHLYEHEEDYYYHSGGGGGEKGGGVKENEGGEEKLDITEEVPSSISKQKEDVVIENCRLRSERQTLFRLPRTGAIVFSFKTYQYRLEDVKREGYGEELAMAIEGLEKGSVPEMAFYKRQVVWGDKVREFLRS